MSHSMVEKTDGIYEFCNSFKANKALLSRSTGTKMWS
jgi:hypothetical protein